MAGLFKKPAGSQVLVRRNEPRLASVRSEADTPMAVPFKDRQGLPREVQPLAEAQWGSSGSSFEQRTGCFRWLIQALAQFDQQGSLRRSAGEDAKPRPVPGAQSSNCGTE